MENIDCLEASFHDLIDAGRKLRKQRDKACENAEQLRNQLKEAKETIKELRDRLQKIEKSDKRYSELQFKKKEIINRLQNVISKFDTLHNVEEHTNE